MATETEQRRTATLVLEVELTDFWAEDLRPDNEDWQRWLADTDTDPNDPKAVGEEILHNIGEVYSGLLTVEVSGEKDGEIVRTPVNVIGARVEDRTPPEVNPNAEHLAARLDEEEQLREECAKDDRAHALEVIAENKRLRFALRTIAGIHSTDGATVADCIRFAQEALSTSDEGERDAS